MTGPARGPPERGAVPRKNSRLKLNLRLIDPTKTKPTRTEIFEMTHTKLKCFLTGLGDTTNGYIVFTDLPTTIDILTSDKGRQALSKLNLETVTPRYLVAKRTVFVNGLDRHVGQHTADEIKQELTQNHDWLQGITVTKIKDLYRLIKITCRDSTQTDKILQDGLMAFHSRIAPHQCEIERHTELLICFNCYKYESHSRNNCPSKTIVCSECAQPGHTHLQCTSLVKRCLNCPPNDNNHRTLAPSCPVKKKAILDKQARQKNETVKQNQQTYSDIVKTTLKETVPTPRPTIQLTDKTHLKLVTLIIEAHIAAIGDKRPYNDIISESLKLNYDLDIKLPDRDSQKILDIYLNPDADQTTDSDSDSDEDRTDMDLDPRPTPAPTPCTSPVKKPLSKQPSPKGARPKRRPSPQQQQTHNKQSRLEPPPYSFRLFRSDKDPEPIPNIITGAWTNRELTKRQDFGLKIHIYGDYDLFERDLATNKFKPTRDMVRIIDDHTFQRYHTLQQFDTLG